MLLSSQVGFVFKCVTHGIRCSSASAGGNQTALYYCGWPVLDWGELHLFVVRPRAPNREVRNVTVRDEYMYRATPNGLPGTGQWIESLDSSPLETEDAAWGKSCSGTIHPLKAKTEKPAEASQESFHQIRSKLCAFLCNQTFHVWEKN